MDLAIWRFPLFLAFRENLKIKVLKVKKIQVAYVPKNEFVEGSLSRLFHLVLILNWASYDSCRGPRGRVSQIFKPNICFIEFSKVFNLDLEVFLSERFVHILFPYCWPQFFPIGSFSLTKLFHSLLLVVWNSHSFFPNLKMNLSFFWKVFFRSLFSNSVYPVLFPRTWWKVSRFWGILICLLLLPEDFTRFFKVREENDFMFFIFF